MRVLVVEGTQEAADVARTVLEAHGPHQVAHVPDAAAALASPELGRCDALLIGDAMADASPAELVEAVRARGSDVPIVVLTDRSELAASCLRNGASGCLSREEGFMALLPEMLRQASDGVKAQRRLRDLERLLERRTADLDAANLRLEDNQRQIVGVQKMNSIVTLVRGICHELNNPLTGILGYAQLLQEIWEGEGADDLREIESCAQRCREIIGKLAKFCRSEKPVMAMVDVNEAVKESLEFVEYFAARHRVKVTSDLQGDLPQTLGLPSDLRQAFLGVFVNAVQSMLGKKGGTLTVRSYASDGLLYVVVSDSGEGIAAENLDRIFLPFFTTRADANGMGLAVAYGVMQDHDGTVLVDSTVGQGSTFSFVMPVRTQAPSQASLAAAPA